MGTIGPDYIDADTFEAICDHMAEGKSVRSFFRDVRPDLSRNWFHVWMKNHATEDQRTQYAHAELDRQDALFEQTLEIADDSTLDTTIGERGPKPDTEWISRSKLRVDTRFKVLARMNREKYGDHVRSEISGPGGKPIQTQSTTVTVTEEEARAISRALDDEC